MINKWQGWETLSYLPEAPEYWPLFNFIFNTPHVVASTLLITGSDSWKEYKLKFIGSVILFSLITFFLFYKMNWTYFLTIYSVLTLKHVILQQFNLSHMFGIKKNILTLSWKIIGLMTALFIYWKVYKTNVWALDNLNQFLILCILIFSTLSIALFTKYEGSHAKKIIFANTMMVLLSYFAFVMGGEFFSVLCIRAVHDVTGFVHYVDVFKARREHGTSPSWYEFLYRIFKSDWMATLCAPILVVSLILTLIPHGPERMSLLMVLSLLHYYTESFTWKSDGVYRKYI